uniref:Protein kinase C-binding protein NELL2 n=1 Tax=Syphacia muris TaxID=451379 RepID=A0A0N5ASY8_9BILA
MPDASRIWRNFTNGNVGLLFYFRQQPNTTVTLFSVYSDNQPTALLIAIEFSTVTNQVFLKLHTDDDMIQQYGIDVPTSNKSTNNLIIFTLTGGHFKLSFNCYQIFSAKDDEISFNPHVVGLKMLIGHDLMRNQSADISILEFTAIRGDPTAKKCPSLHSKSTTNVVAKVLPKTALIKTKHYLSDGSSIELFDKNTVIPRSSNLLENLSSRIKMLENNVRTIRDGLLANNQRINVVEKFHRGCKEFGTTMRIGEKIAYPNCTECVCQINGTVGCHPIGCSKLDCENPVLQPGQCCPICQKKCLFSGIYYESGSEVWIKQCVQCRCKNGQMKCRSFKPDSCKPLTCLQQQTLPNHCCPVCVKNNSCQINNPCSSNADCVQENHELKCICKPGFFGNGFQCYDIDECQETSEVDGICGNCGLCVNTFGGYECQCYPGCIQNRNLTCTAVMNKKL